MSKSSAHSRIGSVAVIVLVPHGMDRATSVTRADDASARGADERLRPSSGHVQDGAPVPAEQPVGPCREPSPDLAVQPLALPARHGDVAGERVQQVDVAVGVVRRSPSRTGRSRRRRTARSPRCPLGRRAGPAAAARRSPAATPPRSRRRRPAARRRTGRRRPARRAWPPTSPGVPPAPAARGPGGSAAVDRSSATTSPRRRARTVPPVGTQSSNRALDDVDVEARRGSCGRRRPARRRARRTSGAGHGGPAGASPCPSRTRSPARASRPSRPSPRGGGRTARPGTRAGPVGRGRRRGRTWRRAAPVLRPPIQRARTGAPAGHGFRPDGRVVASAPAHDTG